MKKLLVLFIVMLTLSSNAQEVLLRYNTQKGDVYEAKMIMKQEVGAFMATTTETLMTLKIKDVSDDEIVNEMTIDGMKLNMIQGENIINYDSSLSDDELDDAGKMMKAQMQPVFEAVISTTQNKLGEILKVSVEPNNPQASQMVDQSTSTVFPEEAVKVGSSWTDTKDQNGLKVISTYTVKSITKDQVDLKVEGDISGLGTGKMSGEMKIDKETGMIKVSNAELTMETQGIKTKLSITFEFEKK